MQQELKRIAKAMAGVMDDPEATRLEKIEAGRISASVMGILIPFPLDTGVPDRLTNQLAMARKVITEKLFEERARKAIKNRRQYVRRRVRELTESGSNPELLSEFTRELESLSLKRHSVQERPAAIVAPVDPAVMQKGLETAKTFLASLEEQEK
jgi:hypothetical protein